MRQSLKKELRHVFEAPEPEHKKEFLRALERAGMRTIMNDVSNGSTGMAAFVIAQIGYIRKWTWGISLLIFALSMTGAVWVLGNMAGAVSALMPLLALTLVSESGRSENYEMAELEMATRFSLKSVVLARMGILGMENLLILVALFPIGIWKQGFGLMELGVYILVPYLLTAFVGLYIVRRFRGRETDYLCAGVAVGISVLVIAAQSSFPQLYQGNSLAWWGVFALLLCIGLARQCAGIVKGAAAG